MGLPDGVLCSRVLQSLWELLLRMILDALTENRGVQVEFYNRFQHTVEVRSRHGHLLLCRALPLSKSPFSSFPPQTLLQFFHARGEGLSVDDMKSGDFKVRPLLAQLQPGPSACRLASLTVCCFRCWMRSSG